MKLNELIKYLESKRNDWKNKEVYVFAKNGIKIEPKLSCKLKDEYDVLNLSGENIDFLIFKNE